MSKLLTLALFVFFSINANAKLIPISRGWSKTSVNATVFRNNSVVSYKNFQFVAYYDSDQYMVLAKRKLGSKRWTIQKTQYQGNCKDAHNVISLMVDSDGYIHVSWDHHANPLSYAKSIAPLSLKLSEKMDMTGEDEKNVTYPEFYKLANGDLIFAYRSGGSGKGNLVIKKYNIKTAKWSSLQSNLVSGEGTRNAYWQICVDNKGIIHISWVWRETSNVATNHDICYAKSEDGGVTWKKSSGETYPLPITASNAEYVCKIPQNSELINQTSMTTDNMGNPYIATYFREQDSMIPQYFLVYLSGNEWVKQQVSERTTPFSLSGSGTKKIPISRPRLASYSKNGKTSAYYIFRDVERNSRVSVAISNDLSTGKWRYEDLTDFSVDSWEPSYDTELWKTKNKLHIFVQKTAQGDGEKTEELEPQIIYIYEL